jgi:hypothetical protein
VILCERSVKIYSSFIRITSINESAISERAISCEVAALSTFACRIERGLVEGGLVLIIRGEKVFRDSGRKTGELGGWKRP